MNALFVLCGVGIVSLLAEIVNVKKGLTTIIIVGLCIASALLISDWNTNFHYYNSMVVFDNFSIAFCVLIAVISILWFFTSASYFRDAAYKTDRSALLVFSVVGAAFMISFNNFAMLFLGIEILSISLYVLAGSRKNSSSSNEASFKYFLMGSFATGFFLFGVALIYGATGTFDVSVIRELLATQKSSLPGFFFVGTILMMAGMAFKMSAAPFHFWAPDVYEGSPTSITAFMSTVVKVASIAAFFKVFTVTLAPISDSYAIILQGILVLTLIIGNVTAVYQSSVKRILAYSSVGHIGYVMLGMIATPFSDGIVFYYLTAYTVASVSAFSVLIWLEKNGVSITVTSLQGLFYRNSLIGVLLTVSLLSLAGIPPLAGFIGKYLVFSAAINAGLIGFVILGVITSLIGIYYYFGIIKSAFTKPAPDGEIELPLLQRILFIFLLILNFVIGLFPDPFISLFPH